MTAVDCRVDWDRPIPVATLSGVLSMADTTALRSQLYTCLAEAPTAIVIDLSDLIVVDDLALAVFSAVYHAASEWPGSAVVLCAPQAYVRATLDRLASRHAPVQETLAAALADAAARPVSRILREKFLPSVEAPRQARAQVAEACAAWGVPDMAALAAVVASELVANAVVHAQTLLELSLRLLERHLLVAVRDGDSRQVRRGGGGQDAESGRGLLIVEGLASAWGVTRIEGGKVVWATVPLVTDPEVHPQRSARA